MPMTKEQKAIYVQMNKANETILRPPGSIAGHLCPCGEVLGAPCKFVCECV
eukprot:SAG22_NODE_5526_length_999_cov_1.316667_2_plen_51_part_00